MDKEKQHIDTKFIDQSWHNMSEILDKEMPVQKRKRRFIWIWFLGLAAILILGIAYQFRTTPIQSTVPKTIIDKVEKVATIETPTINEATSQKDIKTTARQKISKQTQVPQISNNKKQNFDTNTITIADNKSKNTGKILAFSNLPTNDFLLENKQTIEPLQDLSKASILPSKIESNFSKWTNHVISALPLPVAPRFHKEQSIEIMPIVNPVAEKALKWRFGLYAGGLNNKLGSFRGGLHSNLVLSPKWTLHLGIGYASRNINNANNNGNEFADIIALGDNDNPDASEEEENQNSGPATSTSTNQTSGTNDPNFNDPISDLAEHFNYKKFHYIELPILFQYRFNKKWSVDFGGQIGYLYGVRYEREGESNFTTDFTAFSNNTTRIQDVDLGILNNFNFAAIGGFSYEISSKVSAYSNYHFSSNYLTNTPTNSSLKKRWQQIEVGIRYYIK